MRGRVSPSTDTVHVSIRRRGHTANSLSRATGYNENTIKAWLAGRNMPSHEAVAKLRMFVPEVSRGVFEQLHRAWLRRRPVRIGA